MAVHCSHAFLIGDRMEKKRIIVPGAEEGGLPLTLAIECGDYIYLSGMISEGSGYW